MYRLSRHPLYPSSIANCGPAAGGVGGGGAYRPQTVFYVGVANVEEALQRAERLGGTRVLGPDKAPTGIVVGQFTDPEGNLIGVAGPE